jgi:hypothetical protein
MVSGGLLSPARLVEAEGSHEVRGEIQSEDIAEDN